MNLALKIPSNFFNGNFIQQNKNFFLTNQDVSVNRKVVLVPSSEVSNKIPRLSNRQKITEIPEKPCTDHICGCQQNSVSNPSDVARTGAH